MKVLLINPEKKVSGGATSPNMGLLYLASYLRSKNIHVEVLDLQVEEFKLKEYDVVGITTNTPSINEAHRIAKKIKTQLPNCKIVLGGVHVTCLPNDSLKKEYIDFIVRKEGEITFYELIKCLEDRKDLKEIKGLSYKENNIIKHNLDREYIKDLDELPFPAYDLVPLEKYSSLQLYETSKKGMNIITSRGCFFNCNFCYKGTFGNLWRPRKEEKVIEEIIYYQDKYKIKEIGIQDDSFNTEINRAIKICDLIKKEKLDLEICLPNGIRVDKVNTELMQSLKDCGCNRVNFGIEHGNQEMLNKIGKGITLQQVRDACKISKKLKYKIKGFFILGNLGETIKTMEETIKFACSLPIHYASFMIATPYPATRLNDDLIKKGFWSNDNVDWGEIAHAQFSPKAHFGTDEFTKQEVNLLYKKAFRSFYLRPKIITKMLLSKEHWKNMGNISKRVIKEICR